MIWKRVILSWMTLLALVFASAGATAGADLTPKTHVGAIDLVVAISIEASGLASAEERRGNWDAVTTGTSDVPPAARGGGTVGNLLRGATRTNPGRLRAGRAAQYKRPGGFNQANADFAGLNPTNVVSKGGGVRVGQLSGGRTAVVRPRSTQGAPTLEIQGGANPIKVRY